MTKKDNLISRESLSETYHKLSIQVSLNGLSFCILDTLSNTITLTKNVSFGKELSPYEVQKELKSLLKEEQVLNYDFQEVVVIHRNNLFTLVPKALFVKEELANYLKFNVKILANDLVVYDEMEAYEIVNVYVPFVNINNYIYELFGPFIYKHTGTVLVEALLKSHHNGKEPVCYVHVSEQQMDIAILGQKDLRYFNSFRFITREDFIYYLLFTLEQLKLDASTIKLRLFGTVEDGDEIYSVCQEYIRHLSVFIPVVPGYPIAGSPTDSIDFTVMNTL